MKKQIDYLQTHSLRDLLELVNYNNTTYPDNPILKDDIVQILHEEGTYILLYYK